jgi:hypothetical protein
MVKKSIITGIILILLYMLYRIWLSILLGAPSPLWSDTYCGGIDPYHNIECRFVGAGYKEQCRFFVCTKEKVYQGVFIN